MSRASLEQLSNLAGDISKLGMDADNVIDLDERRRSI